MMQELAEVNRRQQDRHRGRIIEEAYNSSQQRHYRMPRSLPPDQETSLESIPSVYDLHAQNRQQEGTQLLPVGLLITLKTKLSGNKQLNSTNVTTKKATLAQLDHSNRRSRIHCTVSLAKNISKQLTPSIPKPSWLCCPKEDTFDQFQTRELTLRQDKRHGKLLSQLIPKPNSRVRGRD